MIDFKLTGVDDAIAQLKGFVPKLRKQAILNALRAGGRVFRDEARRLAPVLVRPVYRRGRLVRKTGTLKRAVSVRTSKVARRAGDVGVFVNVRPAKAGQRGAYSPNDPFYWRFLTFGTRKMAARGFLQGAAKLGTKALAAILEKLGPAVQKIADRQAKQ